MIEMLKRTLSAIALCSLLSLPVAGWGLDGADSWRNLTPKEKENIQRNYQRWQNLPPKDKERLREDWNRWQNLPPDRRDKLRRRYDELQRPPRDDPKNPRGRPDGNKSHGPSDRRDD